MLPTQETTAIKLTPATEFTIEQLVEIYNRTRVDYMVPMPMNTTRLAEYIKTYDVSLEHSLVATLPNGDKLGIIMLGLRDGRAWATRLGVIPNTRRLGIGKALFSGFLEQAKKLSINFCMLEVIMNNIPAQQMFLKFGFREIGELLVLRRSPFMRDQTGSLNFFDHLDREQILRKIHNYQSPQAWTNQYESFANSPEIAGYKVRLEDGGHGWLAYQRQKFLLTRIVIKTENGNPVKVAHALLSHLHRQHPNLDTHIENIHADNPHLPAFYNMGYIVSFRRMEMWLGNPPASKQTSS